MKKIISGKVREVYETDDGKLVIVTTDRISAFDVILDSEIPDKIGDLQYSSFKTKYEKDNLNHFVYRLYY